MKKLLVLILFFSFLNFSLGYNLYSDDSLKSKVIGKIDENNQADYKRIYTDANGKWSRYVNIKNGSVGWVSVGEIESRRMDSLKHSLLRDINRKIKYHDDQIAYLTSQKDKISKLTYQELEKYHDNEHMQGMVNFFNSWMGENGKIKKKSRTYYF